MMVNVALVWSVGQMAGYYLPAGALLSEHSVWQKYCS